MLRKLIPVLVFAVATAIAYAAAAAPQRYTLDPTDSSVNFTYTLLGENARGTMPVASADISIDFARLQNSRVRVALDATGASGPVGFVTDALHSPEVLHTRAHPEIRFVSTRIVPTETGARISGNVTIRGVTRPLTLDARIYRKRGSAANDLSRLTVLMTGTISRTRFGAIGYPKIVDDPITLNIRAALVRLDG
ncbi:MAG: YceI family protein [Pseudomonadota bacterium]